MKKNTITACLCLALSVAIMIYTGLNFLAARELPLPEWGPSVTEVKMLSDWFDGLNGTNGDTPVYVLEGKKPGGAMLILGGTSLAVYPAAGLIDYFTGKHLVVINRDATPRDAGADLLIQGNIGEVLSGI